MNRRGFMSSILALGVAPAIVRAESIMRIKPILLPGEDFGVTTHIANYHAGIAMDIRKELASNLYSNGHFFKGKARLAYIDTYHGPFITPDEMRKLSRPG